MGKTPTRIKATISFFLMEKPVTIVDSTAPEVNS